MYMYVDKDLDLHVIYNNLCDPNILPPLLCSLCLVNYVCRINNKINNKIS